MIEITTPDGPVEAIVARPPGDAPRPGVLMLMDAIGLRPRIEEMAARIAGWGYVVLAPNVFHRDGGVADLAPTIDLTVAENRAAFASVTKPRLEHFTPELAERDLPIYIDALRALPGVASGPIGVVGYCMGAALAVRTTGLRPDAVAACAGFHGARLVTDESTSPHHALATARAEFVFGHAADDPHNPIEAIQALGEALSSSALAAVNDTYPGPHGFTMSDTSSYDEESAERSFTALEDLFSRALG